MRRCVECGRPYRGGLQPAELLDLAVMEVTDLELDSENLQDLIRIRRQLRRASDAVESAVTRRATSTAPRLA